jgi:hypothetical protein
MQGASQAFVSLSSAHFFVSTVEMFVSQTGLSRDETLLPRNCANRRRALNREKLAAIRTTISTNLSTFVLKTLQSRNIVFAFRHATCSAIAITNFDLGKIRVIQYKLGCSR